MSKSRLGAIVSGIQSFFGFSSTAISPSHPNAIDHAPDAGADDWLEQFIPENPERPFYFAFSMLHQPDPVLKRRITAQSLGEYINQIHLAAKQYFKTIPESEGRTCSIIVALKPKRQSRLWIEYHPRPLPQNIHDDLLLKLSGLDAPATREGPVSIAMFCLLWGGIGRDNHPNFSMVPKEWLKVGGGVIPDEPLSKLWPD